MEKKLDVAVVGGGLVGSLEALYLARRGHRVALYEYREDIRKTPQVRGRSINLALSVRGRRALKNVGLEDQMVHDHGIPMGARMIHRTDGSTYSMPYDSGTKQCIYSVGRNYLNGLLLKESEKYDNVKKFFNHKLIQTDSKMGSLTFTKTDTKETVQVSADLIIGADGAFSTVRKEMMKQPLFNFTQEYIEHGYLELCIPAGTDGGMPPNYLHIWPRGKFMMIALPNQDCSWTVTLFMPFKNFKSISSEEVLIEFFEKYFPDSIPLIGAKKLIKEFFAGSPSPLVSVKCRPYHVNNKVLIIGDAAHAVVPFYGQGMNAGFEDCTLLDQLFQKHNDHLTSVLEEFSDTRWRDTFAISDLAVYNYIEMRDLVNRPSYKLRKAIDDFLLWLMPGAWVPLYNSVTFTSMPYNQCLKNRQWQNKCRPYHVNNKVLIIGDAAHAVVPFYGQGMNAGFEDCTLLDQLFQKHNDHLTSVLEEFSDTRWRDTFAISDLAMYNYIEMRDLVNRPSYKLRKAIDDFLLWLMPGAWVPLYNSVTFTSMPYNQCLKNRQWQNKALTMVTLFAVLLILTIFMYTRR